MTQAARATDIRVLGARAFFTEERARAPFSFGAAVASDLTLCHVQVLVENRRGRRATGWGAIFLSHPWAFPRRAVAAETKDRLMRRLVELLCLRIAASSDYAHPLDHFWEFRNELPALAASAAREIGVASLIPPLASLVCASPVDAALHDAFGQANDFSVYAGYGADTCAHDLSAYLGAAFQGRSIDHYLRQAPATVVPIAHTVGGLDSLSESEVPRDQPDDGLPRSLERWIARDGVHAFKVKLHGADVERDLARLIDVHRVALASGIDNDAIRLSADLNEQCANADYARDYLERLAGISPETFAALDYIEQPAPRDMIAHPVDVAAISAIKPVVLDEGLTSVADLELACALGWNGVALKTCKCQSLMLLILALAAEKGLRVTVQDLSNPGLALLQSLGFAARLPTCSAMEANARQFFPAASAPEAAAHPDAFRIRNGVLGTRSLAGSGFGFDVEHIARPLFRAAWPST